MKRCPQCHRFGIEINNNTGIEECIWHDCRWQNIDNINVDKIVHPITKWKFIKVILNKETL